MSVMQAVIGGIIGGVIVTIAGLITGLLLYAEGERNIDESYDYEDVVEKP